MNNRILEIGFRSDVTITLAGSNERWQVHSVLLAAKSGYFARHLRSLALVVQTFSPYLFLLY